MKWREIVFFVFDLSQESLLKCDFREDDEKVTKFVP